MGFSQFDKLEMIMTNGIAFSILVVEDDEDDRFIIDAAFMEIGYGAEVKKFINGEALLHYLEQIEPSVYPSLIVLDSTLPKLDASNILSILKNNPLYQKIPVVVYTTTVSPSKRDALLSMGAQLCLEKGATMDEVVRIAKDLKSLAEASKE